MRCQWYFYFHFFHISGDDFLYRNGTSVESRLQFTTRCQMKRIHRDGFFIHSVFSSSLFYSNALHCGASNWSAFIVFQTNIIQRRQTFYSQWILYYLLNLSLSYSLVLLRIICCFVQTRFLFAGIGFPLVWPLYSVEMYFLIVLHSNDKSLTDVKSSFCVFLTRAHKIEIYWKREEKKTFSEQRTE